MDLMFSGDSGKETIISKFRDVVSDSSIGCRDFQFLRVLPLSLCFVCGSMLFLCCSLGTLSSSPFSTSFFFSLSISCGKKKHPIQVKSVVGKLLLKTYQDLTGKKNSLHFQSLSISHAFTPPQKKTLLQKK